MAYPKIKPCPTCGSDDVAVYKYDHGWQHVECDKCHYLGPGEGSAEAAIQSHNERPCAACGGSGFSGRGTGYDDVCAECGGQRYL